MQRLQRKLTIDRDVAEAPNLCDRFGEEDLETIGSWVWSGYERDKASRAKWEKRMEAAMDLAMQVQKDKNFPWPDCANVIFPLITIAALQFSSRSYANIIQGLEVVKYRTVGKNPDQRLIDRAERISKHMSWQCLEEDTEWEEQHDKLLINVGIVGCNFVKSYFSPNLGYSVGELVMARDLVINYWAKSVDKAPRKTQVIYMSRNEVYERIVSRTFKNVLDSDWFNSIPGSPDEESRQDSDNRKGMVPVEPDEDTPFGMLEQHRLLDLDQDGYYEPYIVTIESSTKTVMKIVARWDRDEDVQKTDFPGTRSKIRSIKATEYFTKYGFIPSPDGGIYDVGFGILLGPLNESVNSGIDQILDSGTMYNSNGGFLGRGAKIRGGAYTIPPWTWKRVDSTGDDLRKSMVPLPVREPSEVMFKLVTLIIEYCDRLAGTVDQNVGVTPGQNTPAETSRNTLEQGMNSYKGIFKRIWRSMKEEFKKKHRLNSLFLPSRQRFGNDDSFILQEDYRSDPDLVVPAADPNLVSDAQRVTQAGMMREGAHQVPGYNVAEVEKNWLRALRVDSIDRYYPGPDKVPPLPNPKTQVEQMKLQGIQMKLEYDKQKFMAQLLADRNKTQAEIVKIYAEVGQLLAQTQTEQVKAKVEAFSAIVDAFKAHSDMMTQQIEAMSGGKEGEGKGNAGSMGGVAAEPGNQGSSQPGFQSPPGLDGAMGGGSVPGGIS